MTYRSPHFGPYKGRFTTASDVEAVLALIESKERLEPSKRDAVYKRKPEIIAANVSAGMFFKIERLAANQQELDQLEGVTKIIAITGAYLLSQNSETGVNTPIATETAIDRSHIKHNVAEIGTTLSNPEFDIPNTDGELPKRCFYRLLVGATTINLFRMAGQEVNGHRIDFDTVTANVQNRPQMRSMVNWLTKRESPLAWRLIERPSEELIGATLDTTDAADLNFANHDKNFYELTLTNLPTTARFIYDCWRNDRVVSDHDFRKNIAHIQLDFSDEMVAFIESIKDSARWFRQNGQSGCSDVRRRFRVADARPATANARQALATRPSGRVHSAPFVGFTPANGMA